MHVWGEGEIALRSFYMYTLEILFSSESSSWSGDEGRDRTTIISKVRTCLSLRPPELGPPTHTLRERPLGGLYNDVRAEGARDHGDMRVGGVTAMGSGDVVI